jgi:hypothetical protein
MADQKPEPTQKTTKGLEIPVPKRGEVMSFIERVAGRAGRKRPAEKDPPQKQSE